MRPARALITTWSKSGRRTSGTDQPLHELGPLARHPRARDDQVEAGRVGAALRVDVDVRVDAERARLPQLAALPAAPRRPRRRRSPALPRSTISTAAPSGCASSALPASRASWPAALSMPSTLEPSSRSSKSATTRATTGTRRRRNSWRTDSGRPHICVVSTRPGAQLAQHQLAARCPASSSSFSVPCTAGAAAAWPNWWATSSRQCQSWLEYGCALTCDEQRRGVDVAVLLHAQVELEVGPVGRQRVDDLLEGVGEGHD